MTSVLISCSMKKYEEAVRIADELRMLGCNVATPEIGRTDASKREHIDTHFEKLKDSDVLIVGNFIDRADDQYGRVGASTFFEAGWAYALNKRVYHVHPLDPSSVYTEDIAAITCGDMQQLVKDLKEKS